MTVCACALSLHGERRAREGGGGGERGSGKEVGELGKERVQVGWSHVYYSPECIWCT